MRGKHKMRGLLIAGRLLAKKSGIRQLLEGYSQCLTEMIGKDNLDIIAIKEENEETNDDYLCINRRIDIISFMCGYSLFVNREVMKQVNELIERGNYDFIFFAETAFGKYIRDVKNKYPNTVIISLYAGINAYQRKKTKYNLNIKRFLDDEVNEYNQKIANKSSDVRILLNSRDDDNLYDFYRIRGTDIIPIFLQDRYESNRSCKSVMDSNSFNMLFVGAYMIHNANGIKWFICNVMTKLDENFHLYVVGSGIERILDEIECPQNVSVIGKVDDLSEYYADADVVVEPIFGGDGMKVKTAEALMYGKYIIATEEALCGYDEKAGVLCHNTNDFLTAIHNAYENGTSKFELNKRQLYIDNYSMTATKKKMQDIFMRFGLEK